MGLITKEVEVVLNPNNVKHYENLGYEIPRYINKKNKLVFKKGTIIKVKVEDLLPGSQAMVECFCDYCLRQGKQTIYEIKYSNYLTSKNKSLQLGFESADCCKNCKSIKTKETIQKKYGTDKIMNVPYFKEKNASKRRRDILLIDEEFIKRGYTPCYVSYTNTSTPLPFICNKHKDKGIQYVRFNDLLNIKCGCKYCSDELRAKKQTFSHEHAETFFINKNYILLDTYVKNDIPMRYVCEKHPCEIQVASLTTVIRNKDNCKYCHSENSIGENNGNWKGGITIFRDFLYKKLIDWRKESLKINGYRCILTGDKDFHIHHLYSFNKIIKETLDILNLKILNNIGEYTNKELIRIVNKFLQLHEIYGFGVPINKNLHNFYHSVYGDDNTSDQFEEFKIRLKSGEFNYFLDENNLKIII